MHLFLILRKVGHLLTDSDGVLGRYLPAEFKVRMSSLLGEQYPAFLASYDKPRLYGLRINTLKCTTDLFLELTTFQLKSIPWVSSGFYYDEDSRPGKHPHYHSGLYYIQEPSAMAPVELLDVQPGERVLDLCAAPGGKSTQIATKLAGQGMLVTNDIHSDRVKALVKNIELSGVRNAVVLNEQPEKLKHSFVQFFDKILIDAPCSGEGMFRKEPDMAKAWEPDWVERYAAMQRELLDQAADMLRPGGRMVYSTCTFSLEENEAMIAEFLDKHPEFMVVPVAAVDGLSHGYDTNLSGQLNSFSERAREAVQGSVRLWPHLLDGEGHFVAVLLHNGIVEPSAQAETNLQSAAARPAIKPNKSAKLAKGKPSSSLPSSGKQQTEVDLQWLYRFMAEHAPEVVLSHVTLHGQHVYASPIGLPDLSGIRIIRPGWYMGTIKKQRFEPSHALAMGLKKEDAVRTIELESTSAAAARYLRGETLEVAEAAIHRRNHDIPCKGYCLVLIDGFPVGWGKWQDGILKNEYPPGWRWT
ncbi:RsmF rRNA methyltransferase first C-terminal domain-containing protein [Paenibacillus periandrae]|uniref:RsmF rRNA methyltransferase first C-terminal domain-containing protein n=1 Tax=Paenibacillus periandrae TaxID=1761741 RepID=UPI0023DDBE72|nr:RsmF rRNA methyltransferase first C-terminal domain-containing protein [Paenibacillus periandrae]